MSHVKQYRQTLRWGAGAALVLLLGWLAGSARAQPYTDPVWQLQQALQFRSADLGDVAALKLRETTLKKLIDQLQTVSDLRRALILTGWKDQIGDAMVSPLLGKGTDRRRTELLADIDREARKEVGERLAKRLQENAARGDVTSKLAVVQTLAEMGANVRSVGEAQKGKYRVVDWRGYARRFTPLLVKLTRDPSPAVRETAARALGKINPDVNEALPALKNMIEHDAVPQRRAAADAFLNLVREISKLALKGRTQTGVEAAPSEVLDTCVGVVPLAGVGLEDRDAMVRRLSLSTLAEAATALGSLTPEPYDPKDVPPRTGPLTPGQVKVVREYQERTRAEEQVLLPLAKALASQGERLARAVNDSDPEARLLARRTLEYMANARLRMRRIWEGLPDVSAAQPAASSRLDGAAPAGVVLAAAQETKSSEDEVLRRGVTPGLMAIAKQLHDPDPVIRRAEIDFLEMLEDAAAPALTTLIRALSDPDIFVRWSAARTLGRIDPALAARAVPALAQLLSDRDLDVRLTAAATLEAYGPAAGAAIPALAAAVSQGDSEFRRAVMYALQSIGPEAAREAVPGLVTDLTNDDARVRRAAAETLGRFGPAARSALPTLRRTLQDEDGDVRQAASDALLSIDVPAR
jgi:HEAT repeat protein